MIGPTKTSDTRQVLSPHVEGRMKGEGWTLQTCLVLSCLVFSWRTLMIGRQENKRNSTGLFATLSTPPLSAR